MKRALTFLLILATNYFTSLATAAFLPPAQATDGMVATSQHLATEAGLQILKEGGNAIDAAVAVGYALAVVDPCCGNIGGGGFMLIHRNDGHNIVINFREQAPQAIDGKSFLDAQGKMKSDALHSFLIVGVPGTVMGLNTALKHYGTMALTKAMEPAIKLAQEGFPLNTYDIKILSQGTKYFQQQPNVASIFLHRNRPYEAGDTLKQPQLAKTLTAISKKGSDVFYHGWIAKEIVAASRAYGGVLTLEDFANYKVETVKPIECNYRGYTLLTTPPPSSGATVCEILNIVEGYPLQKLGFHSAASAHYNIEAMRYSFVDRNLLGDPAFTRVPIEKIISKQHATEIRTKIIADKAGDSLSISNTAPHPGEKPQTTHYSIIDRYGNAVSVTYTLNGFFGSHLIGGNTGFFLNNELDDFNLVPGSGNMFHLIQGEANKIAPGKRPLSSMSPTILLKDNKAIMVVGAAGGSTIITSVVQTIENVIDFGMDINSAVNQPRYHMQWLPDNVFIEPNTFSADTEQLLIQMGYHFQLGSPWNTLRWGQVAAIYLPLEHNYTGASDNRYPSGLAAGYSL